MLRTARSVECELQKKYQEILFNPKYKYAIALSNFRDAELQIQKDTWFNIQLVSYNEELEEIVGYINFIIKQPEHYIKSVFFMNFKSNIDTTWINDLAEAFKKCFLELNFNKICFSVVIGNPAEKQYDNFIKRAGGEIICIRKKHILINNEYKDQKFYEISKEKFIISYKLKKINNNYKSK